MRENRFLLVEYKPKQTKRTPKKILIIWFKREKAIFWEQLSPTFLAPGKTVFPRMVGGEWFGMIQAHYLGFTPMRIWCHHHWSDRGKSSGAMWALGSRCRYRWTFVVCLLLVSWCAACFLIGHGLGLVCDLGVGDPSSRGLKRSAIIDLSYISFQQKAPQTLYTR